LPTAPPLPAAGDHPAQQASASPYRPFWLESELFLVREVYAAGKRHVQGVWLDSNSLRASLLEAIADLLPHATLQAVANVAFVPSNAGRLSSVPAFSSGDPMDLVGLPWKLVPGEKAVAVVSGWTPMRLTLAAAWAGALLAAAAAAALLFGVTRLSERRAAFVSSVTHELRTPLTTFRLYSELLEQGMVRDEADRTQYLHTLRSEAERLTHLVDNVLAYSRIERTNRRSRMERLELSPWIERVKARLEERTREAGMALEVTLPPDGSGLACITDATALEQILFNLVDNACKYAAGRCAEPVVRVSFNRRGRWADLRVCDSGPGIARGERGRLFRPFHKSADEAANSKPGVGLGLALCHRLARALGGRLQLEKPEPPATGACFVLSLPATV
jgi:signal transduction histidine kinase